MALDTATYQLMYYPELFTKIKLINIDHHVSNGIHEDCNLINADVSSACEELFFILKAWDIALIDQAVSKNLLLGLLSDTQDFHALSTSARTLRVTTLFLNRAFC
jgi:nanoRNase/pAp phosphatase (c-di-AMP/oligoRNAs hydrolase)